MKTIIIICVILVLLFIILLVLFSKKKNKEEVVVEKQEENINEADVNMMQGINAGGFTAKEVKQSNIPIPDFKKDKPIGYKDLSHINNTYGERVVNTNNNIK